MPIYEYRCKNEDCFFGFEKMLKMSDYLTPTTEPCPECAKEGTLELVVGPTPLIDPVKMGRLQPDRTFQREVLGRIAKNNPRNNMHKSKFTIPGRIG